MAVIGRDEIMNRIKARIGEDTSDDAIKLVEDLSDTLNDYESRLGEDWKSKYEANDREWRQKYRDRFFMGADNGETTPDAVVTDNQNDLESEGNVKSFDELFTEKEENSGY